ncbi:MAG: ATP-dependent helicase [Candidatus Aenigmarchaeota archaeon]|nr:ATP-dependent helicase [Candidatus Aenigmarchaeota archaeon]
MNNIVNEIKEKHKNDKEQLEVILLEEKRLIVEAPAGYGKTQTMTSKIAYLLATDKVPNPKKILVITFSVNAAQKIKKDILEELPKLDNEFTVNYLNKRITATNYHGFARQIIRKHGYIYNQNLKNIDLFEILEDGNEETISFYAKKLNLTSEEVKFISDFKDAVKGIREKRNEEFIKKKLTEYKNLLLEKLIPNKYITYDGILILAYFILKERKNLLNFYKKLYPFIIIDEFQDTNILSFYLIKLFLEGKDLNFLVLGDPLQQIYGFIGSIPNIFYILKEDFGFSKIKLKKNYRFRDNQYLLNIDKIIREHAKNPSNPNINLEVKLKIYKTANQEEEAKKILEIINEIHKKDNLSQIAILFRIGKNNLNTKIIVDFLTQRNIEFFYALFTDEDKEYREFHKIALEIFNQKFIKTNIYKKDWYSFIQNLQNNEEINNLKNKDLNLVSSLLHLMEIFYEKDIKIQKNILNLQKEEIVFNIKTILSEGQLRQYLKHVNKKIIISTVHSAKGLEWDYVILPDMEKFGFPASQALCQYCKIKYKTSCEFLHLNINNETKFIEEISTFYVACTRAKKDLIFTYSEERLNPQSGKAKTSLSCFLKLKGFIS